MSQTTLPIVAVLDQASAALLGLQVPGGPLIPITGGSSYTLPPATSIALGGVKVGTGLSVDGNGVLSAPTYTLPPASGSSLGGVKVGTGLAVDGSGVLSATGSSVPVAPSQETSDRELIDSDYGKTLNSSSARVYTVNTGRVNGFYVNIVGQVNFTGTATITDGRQPGAANPYCTLLNTNLDTYLLVGGKP